MQQKQHPHTEWILTCDPKPKKTDLYPSSHCVFLVFLPPMCAAFDYLKILQSIQTFTKNSLLYYGMKSSRLWDGKKYCHCVYKPQFVCDCMFVLPLPLSNFILLVGVPVNSRVSTKIQQLLNTLKRPKRPPLSEFFTDDAEEIVEGKLLSQTHTLHICTRLHTIL